MIFVYFRDGRRRDIDTGASFAHRADLLLCLDGDGHEVCRFNAHDIVAYGHIAYRYDAEFVSRPLEGHEVQRSRPRHLVRRRRRGTSETGGL
jgi:hypothetical protein